MMASNLDRKTIDFCFKSLDKEKSYYLEERTSENREKLVNAIGNAVMLFISEQTYDRDLDIFNNFKYWMKDLSRDLREKNKYDNDSTQDKKAT